MSQASQEFDERQIVDFNKQIVDEFRANAGKVGGMFEGKELLILHTIGAKSGFPRSVASCPT